MESGGRVQGWFNGVRGLGSGWVQKDQGVGFKVGSMESGVWVQSWFRGPGGRVRIGLGVPGS